MAEPALPPPPTSLFDADRPNLGRFAGPVPVVNLGRSGLERFRLKEWHYTSISTATHFVAFAIAQLGYVANVFAFVVDRRRPHRPHVVDFLLPLGRGVEMATSSTSGTTRFGKGRDRIEIRYRERGFSVRLDLGIDGSRLEGAFDCDDGSSASVIHRLHGGGIAYTHKGTLYRTTGTLRYAEESLLDRDALATLDWTRSRAERTTVWKWASFAGRDVAGTRVGLNLSADVYDDASGQSQENFLYRDSGPIALAGVRFVVPRAPLHMPWRIESAKSGEVALEFEPLGARTQNLRLGIIESLFVQAYGTFHGRVLDHEIRGVFGVVEDHRARW